MTEIADAAARTRALAPDRSFIIQAPAGSGKTELLTQRVLRLLAVVERPEEILAMTFTRKAAGEMKQRILDALDKARGDRPDEPHKQLTWQLARDALARDGELDWGLLDSPSRLKVMTIDSLCSHLTRQMPLLSELGANPAVSENADALYMEAARNTLAALSEAETGAQVGRLLSHLDNNPEKTAALISNLLGRREQWLPPLLSGDSRQTLEQALNDAVREHLEALHAALPTDLLAGLADLAGFAARMRKHFDKKPRLMAAWLDRIGAPLPVIDQLAAWQGLAELCLTGNATVRARLSVAEGFPAEKAADDDAEKQLFKDRKAELGECLADLARLPEAVELLAGVRLLPAPLYADGQWSILNALVHVLVRAVGELQLVFGQRGEVDFTEIHIRALRALGEEDAPTDLALALDYRLRHILVDEFQDTSSGQYELINKLINGWQAGDGRTLFAVGDPMQSIYGFRQAEVGLFLKAWQQGIGQLPLEPLQLQVNFRSQAGIVDWVNRAFAQVLPQVTDTTTGSVPYSASIAFHPPLADAAVRVHAGLVRDDAAEAGQVVRLIKEAQSEQPAGSIAILVRGRSHLARIALSLKAAGLPFRAVDVEALGHKPAVQDIYNLTRALLHPGDRLAWFSLLRGPWFGLGLDDLLTIAGPDRRGLIWSRLQDPALPTQLTEHSRERLERVLPILDAGLAARRQAPLRDWVFGTWQALGGPASLKQAAQWDEIAAFLDLLAEQDEACDLTDFAAFDLALGRLFAPPDTQAGETLQLMTMHKSKGLEFDTVILPGLGKPPRSGDKPLLTWLERPAADGHTQLLMAPIKPAREQRDAVYDYVHALNKEKAKLEDGRLLYVAATRAKRRLHLIGHAKPDRKGQPQPTANSLLNTLWPAIVAHYADLPAPPEPESELHEAPPPVIERLPADWRMPAIASPLLRIETPGNTSAVEAIPFDWASETARHVGSLVHRYLERIGNEGLTAWDQDRLKALLPAFRAGLANLGVADDELSAASERVAQALSQTLTDPRGQWVLGDHAQAVNEWALSEHRTDGVRHHVIDRSFVDETDTRWIIDYKTSRHEGGDIEAFLDQEQERYRGQLEAYARLVSRLDSAPIQLGLYFPLTKGWRCWVMDEQ